MHNLCINHWAFSEQFYRCLYPFNRSDSTQLLFWGCIFNYITAYWTINRASIGKEWKIHFPQKTNHPTFQRSWNWNRLHMKPLILSFNGIILMKVSFSTASSSFFWYIQWHRKNNFLWNIEMVFMRWKNIQWCCQNSIRRHTNDTDSFN